MRGSIARVALAAAAVAMFASAALSQSSRPIKVIIPYPPGGGADVLARIVADTIGTLHGPVMVVEDRPGAATVIGTQDVVRAEPDGNTLLFTNHSMLLVPHLRKLDYDPLTNLVPICTVAATPTVVIVNSKSPYRKLGDLLDAARAKPGALTYSAAPGAVSHVSVEMILHPAKISMTMVPFNGTPPQVNAVVGGHVDAAFVDYPAAAGLIKSGELRALAVGSRQRIAWLPDVPTVAESGFPDFEMVLWYGFLAPAHTPQAALDTLAGWFAKAVEVADLRARLQSQGMSAGGACGAPFAASIRRQYDDYGRIIRDADIKAE